MEIIIAICGVGLGLIIGLILGKMLNPKNEEEVNSLKSLLESKERTYNETLLQKEESYRRELHNLEESHDKLVAALEKNHSEAVKTLKEQFTETSNAMSLQLKTTTEEMLRQRQQEFTESSGKEIGHLLEPLKQSIQAMQEKVTENTTRHTELGGRLSESIKNLLSHTESAQASADRLASLLKGNSKHQGEWGERILKEILESLNLQEGIHFDIQQAFTDETGKAQKDDEGKMGRPDVILHLDQNKDVIIDSKVSLTAYFKYQEASTDEERQEALRRHIASLERHVTELVKKDYTKYVSKPRVRLGYVIMFVPNTSALLLATNAKPTLWREAMEKNVYIADEQTLYAALKIVSLTWQQIHQNANHAKVFELAEEMLQRVAGFMKSYNEIGENLTKAAKSFKEGQKKLDDGGQSIPKTCRKLIELGAKVPRLPKGVDPALFDIGEEE
ncbi:MAG: DNA recombination protein RmuC [Muribaculaceae bacterium]|nr:DNA recombination protein RmuC [Muribaculaceae bacterium]